MFAAAAAAADEKEDEGECLTQFFTLPPPRFFREQKVTN